MSDENQEGDRPFASQTLQMDPVVFNQVKALLRGSRPAEEMQAGDVESGGDTLEAVFGDDFYQGDELEAVFASLPQDLATIITPETLANRDELEAIVKITGRPSLLISDNNWADPVIEEVKKRLDDARGKIQPLIPSIGRIEITDATTPNTPQMVGTGWMIDDDILVTNSHVAIEFAKPNTEHNEFAFITGNENDVRADLRGEKGSESTSIVRVTKVLWIDTRKPSPNQAHFEFDVAFLRVEKTDFDLPAPLDMHECDGEWQQQIAAIGYPAKDFNNDTFVMNKYFGNDFGVKRLSPGQLIGVEDPRCIEHDCTTLGGSSGSALIDLATGKVVGLHFAGKYKKRNLALKISHVKKKLQALG